MRKIKNDFLYNGEWGVSYDPQKREMLGGYSLDGETFNPEFQITEIDFKDVENAINMCSSLYCYYGIIVSPYDCLLDEYQKEKENLMRDKSFNLW